MADRLYILAVVIGLALRDIIPWWVAIVLPLRDLFLWGLVPFLRTRGYSALPVHFLGKAATFNLLYAFPLLLLGDGEGVVATLANVFGWAFACGGSASTGGPACSTPGRSASSSATASEGLPPSMPDSQTSPGRVLPEHVTLPLLEVITRNTLDEDYKHVAEARAAAGTTPARPKQPRRRAAVVVGLFGLLIVTAAVQTSRNADTNERTREELISQINDGATSSAHCSGEISDLRGGNAELDEALGSVTRIERNAASRTQSLGVVTRVRAGRRAGRADPPGRLGRRRQRRGGASTRTCQAGQRPLGGRCRGDRRQRSAGDLAGRDPDRREAINVRTTGRSSPPYMVLAIGDPKTLHARFAETRSGLAVPQPDAQLRLRVRHGQRGLTHLAGGAPAELRSAEHVETRPENKEVTP